MRTFAAIAVCIAVSVIYAQLAIAGDQPPAGSVATTHATGTPGNELHFVSVLTLHGEIVSIDRGNRLVTLKSPSGETSTLEARNEEDLEPLKVGDHVLIRYFEGAQIGRNEREAGPPFSLKDGIIAGKLGGPSAKEHALIVTVEAVDAAEQEVTLRGPDGSLETIMVANPEYLRHIKADDRVGISHAQALALSFEKEG